MRQSPTPVVQPAITRPAEGTKTEGKKMSQTIEFWFEFASTYSYPAAMRIEAEALRYDVAIRLKPFLLGPLFDVNGWNDSPFNIYPAKGRYMWRDLERICASIGVPLKRPSQFPRGSILAARIVARHAAAPWASAFMRAVYTANFAEDRDISTPETIAAIVGTLGLDAKAIIASAGTPDAKNELRRLTDEATAKGLFGAPSFLVGDELFWGNDRLEQALAWANRARSGPAQRT
jgi:2-hydroxychromene-2-carboxylate isomerase